jgi:hypothetical protein
MRGLVPRIHAAVPLAPKNFWIAGTSPAMTMDTPFATSKLP